MSGIKVVKNRFDVIEKYVVGKKVLDLGCVDARPDGQKKYQTTGLHYFLSNKAARTVGVDMDAEGVEMLNKEGYEVFFGNVENICLNETFDCIVAGEIIEHLSNPGLFLENMKKHMDRDSFIIITAPSAFSIVNFSRILRKNTIKVHKQHTCWFDPITISQLLTRHSFVIKEMYFANKSKWYESRNLFKPKYAIPRLFCNFRSYFSGVVVVVESLNNEA